MSFGQSRYAFLHAKAFIYHYAINRDDWQQMCSYVR